MRTITLIDVSTLCISSQFSLNVIDNKWSQNISIINHNNIRLKYVIIATKTITCSPAVLILDHLLSDVELLFAS